MPSINEELERLPTQRAYAHDCKGLILYLPRTGLVVAPCGEWLPGGWNCVVVKGNGVYPVGGHDVFVSNREILRGVELTSLLRNMIVQP